jgi:hypothetical protein
MDFVAVLLPIPEIMKLKMPRRQRIAVIMLLGVGIIVSFAGVTRTYYMYHLTNQTYDVTWASYPLWISACIELDLGMVSRLAFRGKIRTQSKAQSLQCQICACVPSLRPFITRYFPKLLGSNQVSHSHGDAPSHSFSQLSANQRSKRSEKPKRPVSEISLDETELTDSGSTAAIIYEREAKQDEFSKRVRAFSPESRVREVSTFDEILEDGDEQHFIRVRERYDQKS